MLKSEHVFKYFCGCLNSPDACQSLFLCHFPPVYKYSPLMSEGDRMPVRQLPHFTLSSFPNSACVIIGIQGPPKKCIHTLTKENSTLYNRLL